MNKGIIIESDNKGIIVSEEGELKPVSKYNSLVTFEEILTKENQLEDLNEETGDLVRKIRGIKSDNF